MDKGRKKITIIIPTYNSQRYIAKTLQHLETQTCKDFLVWIIDDNSKDDTVKIVKSFKKKLDLKITVKPKSIHPGAAASINYAFKNLKSNYWALLDSDAYLKKNWVLEILKQLKTKKVVGAPVYAVSDGGMVAYLVGLEIEIRYLKMKKKWLHHLSTCDIAGRAEVLKFIHLNEKLKYGYDHELSFQLKKNKILFYLTKNTYCHHLNKNGILGYFRQQYKIAKYHMFLSKKMTKEAIKGDEISPNYLILQPIFVILSLATLPFSYWSSIILVFGVLVLNFPYILYIAIKKPLLLLPAIMLIYVKNLAWIFGFVEGFIRKDIN